MSTSGNTSGLQPPDIANVPIPRPVDRAVRHAVAELGMYPFPSVRWAWDALWAAVHERAPWTPGRLAHSGDVHARWVDDRCVVNHVCGWPLARFHADRHRVVGTFAPAIPDAVGHLYRSTLVATRAAPLDELVDSGTHAVANSADSLSGWVSLLNATVGASGMWPGRVTFTSAHVESVGMLAAGFADFACIDSWSLAFFERDEPELVAGLHRVGRGPLVPSPAITVHASVGDDEHEQLAAALEEAVASAELAPVMDALFIGGFVRTTLADYRPTLALTAT